MKNFVFERWFGFSENVLGLEMVEKANVPTFTGKTTLPYITLSEEPGGVELMSMISGVCMQFQHRHIEPDCSKSNSCCSKCKPESSKNQTAPCVPAAWYSCFFSEGLVVG